MSDPGEGRLHNNLGRELPEAARDCLATRGRRRAAVRTRTRRPGGRGQGVLRTRGLTASRSSGPDGC